ncbi:MAG TPA: glycosyltransferase family 2 protein [Verrucomicrobiae bacterium]|jgi:glycosyltransferase involved in cell wall biosynthesis
MKSDIITTIPIYNGEKFIGPTLESIARQTLSPDRVIVFDNCSTDRTEEMVKNFTGIRCEFIRNPTNIGLFQNFNRCLKLAAETQFLHILHADDTIEPEFYRVMTQALDAGDVRGLGWCLDRRIDEKNQFLSLSGKVDKKRELLDRDSFLKRKAEIGNQAFCATLLKTNRQAAPCSFPLDYPILGDMIFWAAFGSHCQKIIHVREALANYRWHGTNETILRAPTIQSLILDEWRTMETNEMLRGIGWNLFRKLKLKGLLAVRSAIKAKRVRQNGDLDYSMRITKAARGLTGRPLWMAGEIMVELRDFYLFTILRRVRHPKNIYG